MESTARLLVMRSSLIWVLFSIAYLPDARFTRHHAFNDLRLQIMRGGWTTGTYFRFEDGAVSRRRGKESSLYGIAAQGGEAGASWMDIPTVRASHNGRGRGCDEAYVAAGTPTHSEVPDWTP